MLPCGKNYPAIARILANLSRGCVIAFCGRRILFHIWEPYFAGARSYCGRRIPFCWLLLVLNHISQSHEIACLNTNENDSSEESCEAIKLAVMPVFGILKHLIEVSKTFSAHINLSSHSGISDTFVLYTQSILLIN